MSEEGKSRFAFHDYPGRTRPHLAAALGRHASVAGHASGSDCRTPVRPDGRRRQHHAARAATSWCPCRPPWHRSCGDCDGEGIAQADSRKRCFSQHNYHSFFVKSALVNSAPELCPRTLAFFDDLRQKPLSNLHPLFNFQAAARDIAYQHLSLKPNKTGHFLTHRRFHVLKRPHAFTHVGVAPQRRINTILLCMN